MIILRAAGRSCGVVAVRRQLSLWSTLQQQLVQLGKGSKQLYLDTKQAVQLKRSKQYLSWKEYYFTQQTFASLQKVAPTIVLAMLPIVGYLPMILAFKYSRQLLSFHFWTEEQRKQFSLEEYDERVAKFHVVQKLLARQDSTFIDKVNAATSTTDVLRATISNQMPYFEDGNQWSIERIPSEHVRKLSEAHALLVMPVYSLTPPALMRHWLEQRAKQIQEEDSRLLPMDLVSALSEDELRTLCLKRGLKPNGSVDDMRKRMQRWLDMYKEFKDVNRAKSFLMHAAALGLPKPAKL